MHLPAPSPRNVIFGAIALIAILGAILHRHLVAFLIVTLIVIVVVLGVVVWLIMRELAAAKAGKGIEKDIDSQVEREIERSTFGQQVEVRNLKAEWDAAIAEFKKSSVGRRLGDKALAQLPMYLVIGPSGAGKTALIQESGLQSVLKDAAGRTRAVRGVGGSRSFHWWFTEQAILLDMAGKSLKMSEFDDNEDWVGFLASLRKMRPERPINGVVLTVPVESIAGASREQLEPLAQQLRERTRDLGHHLGMEFPVYVVLTRCDAITGFAETFAAFSEELATQPWGMTFTVARARETAAEAMFDSEFSTLVAALGDLRSQRVARLTDDTQRMRALAFPSQLERMRPELKRFVQVLFARGKDKATDGAIFRGLYLTSAKVGATSVERVIGEAAQTVGLTARLDAPTPEIARHAWFSQQLWRKIIFKDAMLSSASGFALQNEQRQRLLLFGGAGLVWLVVAALLGTMAWGAARPVRQAADAARALAQRSDEEVPRIALGFLEPLRAALAELEAKRAHKSFGDRLAGYAGDGVVTPALEFYVRETEKYLLKPVVDDVQKTLTDQVAAGTGTRFADVFYQYQAYRLLSDEHYAVEPADSVIFSKVLVKMHRPELQRVSDDSLRYYAGLMRAQARMLTEHGEPRHRFGQFDPALSGQVLAMLQSRWSEWPQLYDDMIADANESIAPLGLDAILKAAGRKKEMLESKTNVAGAYTQSGWQSFVRPRLRVMSQMVRREKDPQFVAALGQPVSQLAGQLGAHYADDYVAAWAAFMNGVSARRGEQNSRVFLRRESTGESEIEGVLRRVDAESQVGEGPREVQAIPQRMDVVRAWLTRPRRGFIATMKAKIPFMAGDFDRSSHEAYKVSLGKAAKDKKGIDGGPYTQAQNMAMEFTSPRSTPVKGMDPAVARGMRSLLCSMRPLEGGGFGSGGGGGGAGGAGGGGGGSVEPVDMTALMGDWNALVAQPFSTMQDRYPFSADGDDVRLDEFQQFFAPGGSLDQLFDKHLKGHMTREGQVSDPAFPLSVAHVGWLQKAFAIQEAFFGSGADPKLVFDVKTRATRLAPSQRLHSVTWHVGDKDFVYEMGEEENVTLDWTPENSGQGAFLSADLDGTPVAGPKVAEGDWGLFRVLDKASLASSSGHVIATWKFGGVTVALEISPKKSVHPFSSGFLRLGPPPAADF